MSWVEFVPVAAASVALVIAPGLILGLAASLRPLTALLLSPLLSFLLMGLAAIVLGAVGIQWSFPTFSAVAVGVAVLVLLSVLVVRRRLIPRPPASSTAQRTQVWGVGGAIIAGGLLIVQLHSVLGRPDALSQSYDNIFHLNAVRHIVDTGDGSSLTLNSVSTGLPGLNVYPAAWHDAVALVFTLFPQSLPAAMNGMTVAVAALAWPLSVAFLASRMWPGSPVLVATAASLSAVFLAFPGLMLKWGILYPNMLSYALLPAALGLIYIWVRSVVRGSLGAVVAATVGVGVAAASLGVSHPNGLTSAVALATPLVVLEAFRLLRTRSASTRLALRLGGLGFALLVFAVVWFALRPPAGASVWPPKLPNGQAVGEFLSNSFNGNDAAFALSALLLVGVVVSARRRRERWLVASWLVAGLLWVTVASAAPGRFRWILTGPWYNDSFRLAALTALPALLLAAVGLTTLVTLSARWGAKLASAGEPGRARRSLAGLIALVAVVSLAATPSARAATESVAREFDETADSLLITTDEQNVLDRLDEFVGPDEVIAVNPWDGSALAYGLEDRRVTQFHTLGATLEEYSFIPTDLKNAATDPIVCEQVRDGNVHWYLRFTDTLGIGNWAQALFAGFDGVVEAGVVEPVYTSGGVGLYRIVGCG